MIAIAGGGGGGLSRENGDVENRKRARRELKSKTSIRNRGILEKMFVSRLKKKKNNKYIIPIFDGLYGIILYNFRSIIYFFISIGFKQEKKQ